MPHETAPDLSAARLAVADLGPYATTTGIVIDAVEPDGVLRAHVDADERHHQVAGIVHGGVHATIVETVGSVAGWLQVRGSGRTVVGVANATDFVRPHRSGRLDAVAEPVHVGRGQQLWTVTITRAADGALVARGQLRLQHVDDPGDDRV